MLIILADKRIIEPGTPEWKFEILNLMIRQFFGKVTPMVLSISLSARLLCKKLYGAK